VVLVWFWCGSGVVLVWFWCGLGHRTSLGSGGWFVAVAVADL
jgi:hypothetical protein